MQLGEVLDHYQLQLRANGRSVHTQRQYERHLRLFEQWLLATGRPTSIEEIDHIALAEFLCSPTVREKRGGGPRKATSANGLRSSLRAFFGWARDAGYVSRSPAALVQRARCSPVPQRALSADERRCLELVLESASGEQAERDRLMVAVLLGCGLRVASLVGLHAADVGQGEILVRRGKNDAPMRVFVPKALRANLERYAAGRSGPLFAGRGSRPLTTRHVARRLRGWCERAGIAPCGPHSLRRTFGTALYRASRDAFVVQCGLGHRSLASTLPYVLNVEDRLREMMEE